MPCLSTYSIGHFAGKVNPKPPKKPKKFSAIAGQKGRFRQKRLGRFAKCPKPATCIGGEAELSPALHAGRSTFRPGRRAVTPAATVKGPGHEPRRPLPGRVGRLGQSPPTDTANAERTTSAPRKGTEPTGGRHARQRAARPIILAPRPRPTPTVYPHRASASTPASNTPALNRNTHDESAHHGHYSQTEGRQLRA